MSAAPSPARSATDRPLRRLTLGSCVMPSLRPTTFTTLPRRTARTLTAHHPRRRLVHPPACLHHCLRTRTRLRLSCSGVHMRSSTCVSSSSPTLLQSPATLPDLIKREDVAAGGQRAQGSLTRCARNTESACAVNVSRIGVLKHLASPRLGCGPPCPPPPSSRA
ncbi:hypothetical protein B0H13DRAFT_2364015 [Mycena leptocephala]|nr:hypothetical protein B0H13DRAFT_2364015 [Mycena leptocephala]